MDLSSGPSKRARMSGNGSRVPFCLVDGCTSDLSKCRDYHRRHKVCELHSKTARVSIKGQEQRFCQQCSRFHSLGEFDEGKRSCRKRLEGHNRRRRKPQPDPLNVNSSTLFPNHQGSRYIHFGGSQIFSASAATAALTGVVKAEDEFVVYNCQSSLNFSGRSPLPGSLSNRYKGGKQFPFLQGSASMFPGGSTGQANLDATSNLVDSGNSQKMFSDGLNRAINSNCALSLLSSPPAETGEINLSHMVQPDLSPPAQSLISNLDYNSIGMESEPVGSFLVAGSGSNANLHGHNMFHMLPDGSSASGAQQTLSFSWE